MGKMKAFDVMLDNKRIDTVFFREDTTEEEARQSLIEYDHYDPDIQVRDLEKTLKTA